MGATIDLNVLDPGQSRLRLRADLVVVPYDRSSFVIEDPLSGKFFLVGTKEWSFISQLDGKATIAAAVGLSATRIGNQALVEQEAIAVARWLVEQGLARPVEHVGSGQPTCATPASKEPSFNPLAWRWPLGNPDPALSVIAPLVAWIWSPGFFCLWLLIGAAAAIKLAGHASAWWALPAYVLDVQNWLRLTIVWCLLKFVHELAHGLACKHYGAPVRQAGIMFLLLAPLPYVDVSRAWRLASPWQRIVISAAGMYIELLLAFAAILAWTPGSLNVADRLCVDLAMLASVHTLAFNANPLMRFDGYYILADALGIPNLYGEGQQRLAENSKYWFCGVDFQSGEVSPTRKRITLCYGLLSLVWRCLTFAGMAVGLLAVWSWWGVPAVFVWWVLWFGWPFPKRDPQAREKDVRSPAGRRRQWMAWGSLAAIAGGLALWLISPAHVTAPAVVEYAPLTVLRSKSAGFVSAIHVQCGQEVELGQLLVELSNEDLRTELKAVEIGIEQARTRGRKHFLEGEFSKQQAELATAKSLELRRDELRVECENLQVRAPCAATVVSRDLSSRLGGYVERGDMLVALGSADKKEVLVSISAMDGTAFQARQTHPVIVQRDHVGAALVSGRLSEVEPRASQRLPHVALGADFGGPVAVQPADQPTTDEAGTACIALNPRFIAKVTLDGKASREFRAGQRVVIGLDDGAQCWAYRIWGLASEYLQQVAARTKAPLDKRRSASST